MALALFCLLPTCLHLQQNKRVLEATPRKLPPTPNIPAKLLPWSAVNNVCDGDSSPKSYLSLSAEGLGEKKGVSFHEPSLIECDGKGCNKAERNPPENFNAALQGHLSSVF